MLAACKKKCTILSRHYLDILMYEASGPEYLTSKLSRRGSMSGRITRNSQQVNIPFLKTVTGQKIFHSYRSASIWNKLDSSLN